MKSEKGITLTVLVIYTIVFSIIIVILANLTNYIYGNLHNVNDSSINVSEFNKFNVYFIDDVKTNNDAEIKNLTNGIQVTFADGDSYLYVTSEKTIYKNKQKIAKNIQTFNVQKLLQATTNKKYLKVTIEIATKEKTNYLKTIDYVLKYW